MNITDRKMKELVRRIKCVELKESILTFPEAERYGKTDRQIIIDEVDYFKEIFEEDGNMFNLDLERSIRLLRRTKNGKEFPTIDPREIKRLMIEVEEAKRTVSEYRQIRRISETLRR